MKSLKISTAFILLLFGWGINGGGSLKGRDYPPRETDRKKIILKITHDERAGTLAVFRKNAKEPILTQHARQDLRPYIHPIAAPDGKGMLTQFSPEHHKHQTGLYWGLKLVNGRDYFMNWQSDYWRRVSAKIIQGKGPQIKWQTV